MKAKKCSSLAPFRDIFYPEKKSVDKIWSKKDWGWKVPSLMPIRVKENEIIVFSSQPNFFIPSIKNTEKNLQLSGQFEYERVFLTLQAFELSWPEVKKFSSSKLSLCLSIFKLKPSCPIEDCNIVWYFKCNLYFSTV